MDGLTPNPEQKVILFLHGFMGSGGDWLPVISRMSDNFICLAPDLPGHGKNLIKNRPGGFLFPQWANGIISWLKAQGITSCDLAGYSMGGRLALHIAFEYPEFVRSLILESASPGIDDPSERAARLKRDRTLARQFESRPLPQVLDDWYDQPLFSGIKALPDFRTLYRRRLTNNPEQLAAVLRGTSPGLQPSRWPQLPDLRMPVLAVAGENDRKYLGVVRRMREYNPEITPVTVPAAGHNIHFESPDTFSAVLRDFLSAQQED